MSIYRTIIASVLMLFTVILVNKVNVIEDNPMKIQLSNFPKQISKWNGRVGLIDQKILEQLGVEDSFYADYTSRNGIIINLYIAFYESQREGDMIHSPKNCMPGGGWNITKTSLEEIDFPGKQEKSKIIKLNLQNGPNKQVVLYWYQSRGRIINSEYLQRIYLVIDSITKRRTDGSFIRLIAPVINDNHDAAVADLKEFARLIFPILEEYIPS